MMVIKYHQNVQKISVKAISVTFKYNLKIDFITSEPPWIKFFISMFRPQLSQTENNLRLSFQSASSVSGTELRDH